MGSNLGHSDPSLTRHAKQLFPEFGELQDAAEAMRSLRAHEGWQVLTAMLRAEVAMIDAGLDGQRVLDSRAEYAARLGRRGGLLAPELMVDALISRAESRLSEQRAKHEGIPERVPARSTA